MEYELKYGLAMEKCKMLSSYEGRDASSESGESIYLKVKITEQDEPLLRSYMEKAARMIEERISRMMVSSEYGADGFRWRMRTDETRWNKLRDFGGNVLEAVVSYAMGEWMSDKIPGRTEMYKGMFADMSVMVVKNIFFKMPPKRPVKEVQGDVYEVTLVES